MGLARVNNTSLVSDFLRKVREFIPQAARATKLTKVPVWGKIIATGDEIDEASSPRFYALWQGQALPDSYVGRRFAKGRLEIFTIHREMKETPDRAEKYLHDLNEAINRFFHRKRQALGLRGFSPLLTIPTVLTDRAGNRAVQLRAEYSCTIA